MPWLTDDDKLGPWETTRVDRGKVLVEDVYTPRPGSPPVDVEFPTVGSPLEYGAPIDSAGTVGVSDMRWGVLLEEGIVVDFAARPDCTGTYINDSSCLEGFVLEETTGTLEEAGV